MTCEISVETLFFNSNLLLSSCRILLEALKENKRNELKNANHFSNKLNLVISRLFGNNKYELIDKDMVFNNVECCVPPFKFYCFEFLPPWYLVIMHFLINGYYDKNHSIYISVICINYAILETNSGLPLLEYTIANKKVTFWQPYSLSN